MYDTSATRVVVGADGSPSSGSAVRIAARQASLYGCPLRIVHAFNWAPTMAHLPGCEARMLADELVDRCVRLAAHVAPEITVDTHLVEGSSTTALLREARTAALLVVGDGGLGSRTCLPTESGTVRLAACAPCTVLIARARQRVDGPIVVGVDQSAVAGRVLDHAFVAAARQGTALLVVRAVPSSSSTADAEVRALVEDVRRRAELSAVRATVQVTVGDPADVLRRESAQAGMLIVGPRGDHLGRGLLGPVTQTLLHHASVPLVVVRRPMPVRPDDTRRWAAEPTMAGR
jgi:nucleotide-binding universal stress UspA family protein